MLATKTRDYLDKIYFNKDGNQGSFSTLKNLLRAAKKERPGTTAQEVKLYLQSVPTYQKHRRVVRRFPRRKLLTFKSFDIWQTDIIYLKRLDKIKSRKVRNAYAVTTVDPFNRVAHARVCNRKTPADALKAFQQILKDFGGKPAKLHVDEGSEWKGVFKAWCDKENIEIFHSQSGQKAFLSEGVNRDLKVILSRIKSHHKSEDGSRFLSQAVAIYNNSSSTGLPNNWSPNEAKKPENYSKLQLWHLRRNNAYFKKLKKRYSKAKYLVGQKIKIAEKGFAFSRGFAPRFKDQVYTILAISRTVPRTYAISDTKKARFFYEPEIQPIIERENIVKPKIKEILSSKVENPSVLRSGKTHGNEERKFLVRIDNLPANKYMTQSQLLAYENGQEKLNEFLSSSSK